MATGRRNTPHPLVTQPTLWAVDVPAHVKWAHLVEVMMPCGPITSRRRSKTPQGRQRWEIVFSNIYYGKSPVLVSSERLISCTPAEMALATLNGVPVPDLEPPWTLTLSHNSSLDSPFPSSPLCPQCAKFTMDSEDPDHPLQHATAQQIFNWFRVVGPLVYVQKDVNVGYPSLTCVIQYWQEEDAVVAHREAPYMFGDTFAFTLRTFVPWAVSAAVGGIVSRVILLSEAHCS